jgi:hypothetical protein
MKSAFGSKRRARKIEVDEEEDDKTGAYPNTSSLEQTDQCKHILQISMDLADLRHPADSFL